MSLREKFKNTIEASLYKYEGFKSSISDEDSIAITHIRELLRGNGDLLELRDTIYAYVDKLSGSFFSFLPFINDLKSNIKNVINTPEFLPIKCVVDDYKLLKEMTILKQNQNEDNQLAGNYISRNEYEKGMQQLEEKLREEITHYKGESEELRLQLNASELANKKIVKENDLLKEQLASINLQLQTAINTDSVDIDISKLQIIVKQKDAKINDLNVEIKRLKEALNNTNSAPKESCNPVIKNKINNRHNFCQTQ